MTSRYLLRVKACSSYPTCGDGVLVEWIRWIYQMRIHHALSRTLAGVLPSSGPVCDDSVSKLVRNLSYQSLREEKPHVR